jgi:hypothetical protein
MALGAMDSCAFLGECRGGQVGRMDLGADPDLHDHAALFTASCDRVGVGVAAS